MGIMEKTILRFCKLRYLAFFILFIFVSTVSAQESKIVLATFDTLQRAEKKLEKFQAAITPNFISIQAKEGFDVLIRPSGKKYYILTIEPIQSKKIAKQVRKLLPRHFRNDSFIGNYSLKTRYKTKNKIFNKHQENNATKNEEYKKIVLGEKETKDKIVQNKTNSSNTTIKTDSKIDTKIAKENVSVAPTVAQEKIKEKETNITENLGAKDETHNKKSNILVAKEQNKTDNSQKNISDKQTKEATKKQETKEDIGNKSPFSVTLMQTINDFASATKEYTISIFSTLLHTIISYLFEISVLIFIVSLVLFIFAYKKSIVLYRKIRWLKASKHVIAKDTEFLKTDINNLKAYFNSLVSSASPSLQKLQEHFEARDTSIEEKEAQDAIHSLMHVMKSYDDFGGNIILTQKEFDLNALVKRVLQHPDIKKINSDVSLDFNSPMLKKVVGDSQKISRILTSLITFCCKYSTVCRVLVILNEAIQDTEGNVMIKIIIKNSKGNFTELGLQKIEKAFSRKIRPSHKEYDDDVLDLIAVQRILEAKRGEVKVLENFRGDGGFIFDMRLKIINRHIIQNNLFSSDSFSKQNILIFGNNAESVRTIQSELELVNLNTDTCYSWNQMLDSFNDIYFFIDIVIVQNATLPFVDIEALNSASRRKNFITVAILEEHEDESMELKRIRSKRILKRPYEKDSLPRLLYALIAEQKPTVLNS